MIVWAVRWGHVSPVEFLAEQIPLQQVEETDIDRSEHIWYRCSRLTSLGLAFCTGQTAIVRILLAKGADPNHVEAQNATALHHASCHGYQAIVSLLLRHGADIDKKDEQGDTPLHQAVIHKHENISKALIEHVANLEAKNEDGKVALHYACRNGHLEIVNSFLNHNVKIENKNTDGNTTLHEAANRGNENVIKALIDNGANIEARDYGGRTAIMFGASPQHGAAISVLLKAGANLLATDNMGLDIRHWIVDGFSKDDDPVSNNVMDMIYTRFCHTMYSSLPCPPLKNKRRAEIIFSCTTEVQLGLCSRHAHMEIPPDMPPGLTVSHKRFFSSDRRRLTKFTLSIVHQEEFLDFAVKFFSKGAVELRVVEGGERFAVYIGRRVKPGHILMTYLTMIPSLTGGVRRF